MQMFNKCFFIDDDMIQQKYSPANYELHLNLYFFLTSGKHALISVLGKNCKKTTDRTI